MNDIILDSISDGVFTVDEGWRITSFNRAAEEITGVRRDQALGQFCHEVFKSDMCESRCPLRSTLGNGKPLINQGGYIVDTGGNQVPVTLSTALLKDKEGTVLGGAETFRDMREVQRLKVELENSRHLNFVGDRSAGIRGILQDLPAVAGSLSTVLIGGETGTGKEVLARLIHRSSPRSGGPFVSVNCGALPENLIESELFGYKKGAFTGADRDRPGKFAQAQDGTLFLDEVGDLSPATQVRLLRVLQEHEYDPLGARKPEKTNARILCATHKDLGEMVKAGLFRQDLYYRIHVIHLKMPPLRERQEDLPALVDHFLEKFRNRTGQLVRRVSPQAFQALFAYPWPGNIRELENALERAFVLAQGGEIALEQLPEEIRSPSQNPAEASQERPAWMGPLTGLPPDKSAGKDTSPSGSIFRRIRDSSRESEQAALENALVQTGGNITKAAEILGVDRSTLYRRMKVRGLRE